MLVRVVNGDSYTSRKWFKDLLMKMCETFNESDVKIDGLRNVIRYRDLRVEFILSSDRYLKDFKSDYFISDSYVTSEKLKQTGKFGQELNDLYDVLDV